MLSPSVQNGLEREMNSNDIETIKSLGKGAFGDVFQVIMKTTGKKYALKQINKGEIRKTRMEKHVALETKIMYSIDHINIIKLHNHFEDETNCNLLMEFAYNVS